MAAASTAVAEPPCLSRDVVAAPVADLRVRGDRVAMCFGEGEGIGVLLSRACGVVDVKTGKLVETISWRSFLGTYAQRTTKPRWQVETTRTSVSVCSPDGRRCKTIRVAAKPIPDDLELLALPDADGTALAVIVPEANQLNLDIYDVPSQRRLSRTQLTDGGVSTSFDPIDRPRSLRWVGRHIIVGESEDGQWKHWLATPRIGYLAALRGAAEHSIELPAGGALVLDELFGWVMTASQSTVHTVRLDRPIARSTEPRTARAVLAGNTIVVAHSNAPMVTLLADLAQGHARTLALPVCK